METVFVREENKKIVKAREFYHLMNSRRTIRRFSKREIHTDILNECIRAAGTAPSGANKQPWFFAVIKNQEIKIKIKEAAEKEEFNFYNNERNKSWIEDLKPFKTNWKKPHLKEAAALIVIFSKTFEDELKTEKCYYQKESTGIATGVLITALHRLGLSTLTHTPNPMSFLNTLLGRPNNERPFLILAVGYKDKSYKPPVLKRKSLKQISQIY